MASQAQLDANRLNSQFSPGPRTAEGKAASAANAFKHGLYSQAVVIPGEDPADYDRHAASYRDRFQAVTPEEDFQVETLIEESWKRRRYSRIEAAIMRKLIEEAGPSDNPLAAVLSADNPNSRMVERIIRAREACTRAWDRAFQRLMALMADRTAAPQPAATERTQSPPPPPGPNAPERSQTPPQIPFPAPPANSNDRRELNLALRLGPIPGR
jgi:hypothetical protein